MLTLVYRIDVQYKINVQVGKFLKNIKRAGQNRCAGGKLSGKSINVQGEIFLKKALILHFNDSVMVSEFSFSFLQSIAILPKSN